jgi:hypothetical protein
MPDKKAYIEQMMRVLKPGVILSWPIWCQRDDRKSISTNVTSNICTTNGKPAGGVFSLPACFGHWLPLNSSKKKKKRKLS